MARTTLQRFTLLKLIIGVGASLGLAGCEVTPQGQGAIDQAFEGSDSGTAGEGIPSHENPIVSGESCYSDRFTQPEAEVTKKLDLLFVTDTSGSINQERGQIAEGIDAFVKALPAEVDLQVAVMLAHGSTSKYSGRLYQAKSEPYVLSNQQLSMSELRSDLKTKLTNTRSDYLADGGEEGLYSVWRLFNDAGRFAEARYKNFLRLDAALAIVFVSDENDICAIYPEGVKPVKDREHLEEAAYYADCVTPKINLKKFQIGWETRVSPDIVYDRIKSVWGERPLVVSGIVYTDHNNVPKGVENEYGYGYMEIIQKSQGVAVDLAQGNFDAGLRQIGELSGERMNLNAQFQLSRETKDIAQETIRAFVDGELVNHTYDATTRTVTLDQVGTARSNIEIEYCSPTPAPEEHGDDHGNGHENGDHDDCDGVGDSDQDHGGDDTAGGDDTTTGGDSTGGDTTTGGDTGSTGGDTGSTGGDTTTGGDTGSTGGDTTTGGDTGSTGGDTTTGGDTGSTGGDTTTGGGDTGTGGGIDLPPACTAAECEGVGI